MNDGATPAVGTLADLLARLLMAHGPSRRIVGVAGAPGAGKTTLVATLTRVLTERDPRVEPAHLPGDGFHLADVELARLGRLDRKGAPDTFDAAGYAALLGRLRDPGSSGTVYAPAFDRTLEQPLAGAIPIAPTCRLVLTECNYLLLAEEPWAQVRCHLDEVWFVEVDDDERRRRLVERHVRFGKSRAAAETWIRDVDEPDADLVAATRPRADVVVVASAPGPGSVMGPAR